VLVIDGKPVSGEDLQWFPNPGGSPDAPIGAEYIPVLSADGKKALLLMVGSVRGPARSTRVIYRDGSTEPVDLAEPTATVGGRINGFFVYEIT
jgi:hypothetical protein